MEKLENRKIVLVKRRTRLDELIARFNSISQARFYIEHLGADFSDYEKEHSEYLLAIQEATAILGQITRLHVLERAYLPNFLFAPDDVVVAIGQDGMVANTLKYLSGQPCLGVNPAPDRWDGVLLPFLVRDLKCVVPEVMRGARQFREVSMAAAALNDGQTLLAVNDLFIGQKTHISARYTLTYDGKSEQQSSSGIIVSTGLGSTGWMKSILTGADGVVQSLSGKPQREVPGKSFDCSADYLYYSVREPFPSKTTGTTLIFGKITGSRQLTILSQMAENGVIFSDGIESDFLQFNSGMEAVVSVAGIKGILVV